MDIINEIEAILIKYGFEKHDEIEYTYELQVHEHIKVLSFIEDMVFCVEIIYSGPHFKETTGRKLISHLRVQRPEMVQELLEGLEWVWAGFLNHKRNSGSIPV